MNKSPALLFVSLILSCFLVACGDSSSAVAEFTVPAEYADTASDICVSQEGGIYVAAGDSILEYTSAGEETRTIPLPERSITAVASSRDMLYAYDMRSRTILEINGKGSVLRLIPLASDMGNVTKLLASEDTLFLMYENASCDNELLSVSLSDGSETLHPISDLYDMGIYDQDHLLVRIKTALYLYDPATKETGEQPYYNLPFFNIGYVFDPREKLLYYVTDNTLYRMEEKSQEHSVVKLLNHPYRKIAFLSDTVVLFAPQENYICALNPKTFQEETVSIRTYEFDAYSRSYAANYTADTGVEIVDVLGSVDEKFLKQLMAGDSGVDIYVLSSYNVHSLGFLSNHAYTDLSLSETLVNTVGRMHRSLRDSAYQGDELAGIPLAISGTVMAFNPESEACFLAGERITDWESLLLLLEELPPGSTILGNKAGIYQQLFRQYLYGYCEPYKGKADFDTDTFRSALDLMTRIHDCPDFQDPGTGPGDIRPGYYSDNDFRQTDVLGINSSLRLDNIASPHRLPDLEEGRNLAPLINVSYVVVNPNSEHKEEAIRYLEALVTGKEFSSCPEIFPLSDHEELNQYLEEAQVSFDQGVLSNVVSILYAYAEGKISKEEAIASIQEKADLILGE